LSVDPLAANYAYFTPYQFAGNKPILFIDLDGAEYQIPTFEKFKYGNNAALNVVTVVDNVAINSVNGGITLLNSSIYTVHRLFTNPSSLPEELKSDLGAMAAESGKYLVNQYDYAVKTPIKKQLGDAVETLKNPESYEGPAELATALFLTKNFKLSSRQSRVNAVEVSNGFDDLVGFRKDHILNRHRNGAGKPGKSEFPSSWNDNKIIDEVNRIANDPKAPGGDGKWHSPFKTGVVEGIEIRVDFYPSTHPDYAGKVSTAYPVNITPNPKK